MKVRTFVYLYGKHCNLCLYNFLLKNYETIKLFGSQVFGQAVFCKSSSSRKFFTLRFSRHGTILCGGGIFSFLTRMFQQLKAFWKELWKQFPSLLFLKIIIFWLFLLERYNCSNNIDGFFKDINLASSFTAIYQNRFWTVRILCLINNKYSFLHLTTTNMLHYISTSTSWRRRSLKSVPRSDLD